MLTPCELGIHVASKFLRAKEFMERLELLTPIIQAPMAGIATDIWLPHFTDTDGKVLFLPSYGAGYMQGSAVASKVKVYAQSASVFNFNLFIPSWGINKKNSTQKHQLDGLWQYLSPYYKALGVAQPEIPYLDIKGLFWDQLDVLLEHKIPVFSFTFGRLPKKHIEAFKRNGTFIIGSAVSIRGAQQLIEDGCDAIVLQSPCAGGHLSLFEGETIADLTFTVVELIRSARLEEWDVPCIAAGGIRNAEEVETLFKLGVSAIQLGTSFLACRSSGLPTNYLNTVSSKNTANSVLTSVVSGRMARTVENRLYQIMLDYYKKNKTNFPPYPWPHLLTASLRAAAMKNNDVEHIAAWCGINDEKLPDYDFNNIAERMLNFRSDQQRNPI